MNIRKEKDINRKEQNRSLFRFLSYLRSFLPQNGESKDQIIFRFFTLFFGCVFLICAAVLLNDLVLQPAAADRAQQAITKVYYADSSSPETESAASETPVPSAPSERDAQGRLLDFLQLQKINPDIAGWIKISNTDIDLPVLQADSANPEFYLDHDYNKNPSKFGSIFADSGSIIGDNKSRSILLYGHSLNSGRMFTELNRYKNYGFLKANPTFTFDTADGSSQWKILSVLLTNTLPDQGQPFDYLKTEFKNDSEFLNFVYQLRIRSLFNTGVSFQASDKILLLSTCSYEFQDFREVVVARKVRDEESAAVDTAKILYNNKTVYPDCWYKKNGGEKPVWPATYEQAFKNRVLSWGEKE